MLSFEVYTLDFPADPVLKLAQYSCDSAEARRAARANRISCMVAVHVERSPSIAGGLASSPDDPLCIFVWAQLVLSQRRYVPPPPDARQNENKISTEERLQQVVVLLANL